MNRATHVIELEVGINIDKVINNETISTLGMLFNTDDLQEILACYGQYIVDNMTESVKSRIEFAGLNAQIKQVKDTEDTEDIEVIDSEPTMINKEPLDVLPLLDSIYSTNNKLQDEKCEVTSLIVNSKYDLTIDTLSIDTGVESTLIEKQNLNEIDYQIIFVDEDGNERFDNIKLPKGENK